MCLAPVRIASGVQVACDACKLCRSKRRNDFVGRCIAEQCTSSSVFAVTLTYRGDSLHATSLYYKDVQLMLKRLRADGYPLRYLCVGEHGEKKGRAHWHCIFFFQGRVPPGLVLDSRVDWPYWPAGLIYAQTADYSGFSYLLKYTLKDETSRAYQKRVRLSKYPPLGSVYFADLADRMAEGGFAMHAPEYSFSHCQVRGADGVYRARVFWLWDRSRELFLDRYVTSWRAVHGSEPPMTEFLVENYFDPAARRERLLDPVDLEASIARRRIEFLEGPKEREVVTWAQLRGILSLPPLGSGPDRGSVARFSDGSVSLVLDGGKRHRLHAGSSLGAQLARCGLPEKLRDEVVAWVHSMPEA